MADPKATPISALPKQVQPNADEDQAFIQNILQKMNDDNKESQQAYQQTQDTYQQQQFAVNHEEIHKQNQKAIKAKQAQQAQYEHFEDDAYEEQYQYQEEEPLTFMEKVKRDIKTPILFIVLFFILCLPAVRKLVMNQIGRFSQNESLHIYGSTLALGIMGAIVFYVINKFLIKF